MFRDHILGLELGFVLADSIGSPHFSLFVNDLAFATKVPTPHVCSRHTVHLYGSLQPDGQPLTLGGEVEEYLCLPVSSDRAPSGYE